MNRSFLFALAVASGLSFFSFGCGPTVEGDASATSGSSSVATGVVGTTGTTPQGCGGCGGWGATTATGLGDGAGGFGSQVGGGGMGGRGTSGTGGGGDGGQGGATGKICGGIVERDCDPDEYCDFDNGSCGEGDEEGHCRPRPTSCDGAPPVPVCGCNGGAFASECLANQAGQSISPDGSACVEKNPERSCGEDVCSLSQYCEIDPSRGLTTCLSLPDGCNACDCLEGCPNCDDSSGLVVCAENG